MPPGGYSLGSGRQVGVEPRADDALGASFIRCEHTEQSRMFAAFSEKDWAVIDVYQPLFICMTVREWLNDVCVCVCVRVF